MMNSDVLTPDEAKIIALTHLYLVPGFDYPISLLEIQKLVYFLNGTSGNRPLGGSAGARRLQSRSSPPRDSVVEHSQSETDERGTGFSSVGAAC